MTVPRGHYLKELPRFGMSLISYPYNIMSIVESELASNDSLGNGTVFLSYADVQSGALYFEANITGLSSSASLQGSVNFTFSSSVSGEYVTGGTFINSGDIWLDRGHTNGFDNPYFSDKFSATGLFNPSDASWRISGIIDRSIIELFLNGGELSSSSVFFPTRPLDIMALSVAGLNSSAQASVAVYSLKAAWLDQVSQGRNTDSARQLTEFRPTPTVQFQGTPLQEAAMRPPALQTWAQRSFSERSM